MTRKQNGRVQEMTGRCAAVLQTLCSMEKRERTVSAAGRMDCVRFLCTPETFSDNGTTRAFLAMAECWIFKNMISHY